MECKTTIPEAPAAGRDPRARGAKRRIVAMVLEACAATLTFTACPDKKGPAEKAGEAVDNGVDKLKDAVTPDGPAEKLGKKIDKATE